MFESEDQEGRRFGAAPSSFSPKIPQVLPNHGSSEIGDPRLVDSAVGVSVDEQRQRLRGQNNMRIACVFRPESVNANYRALIPLVALQARGHRHELFDAHTLPNARQFTGFDVVHFCRTWEEPFQRLARKLRAGGIGVIWDCDDNLPAIEKETSSYRAVGGFRGLQVGRDMRTMMRLAHVVTTPSEILAEQFEANSSDVRVIENYLAPPMILRSLPMRVSGNFRVGWIAGNEHRADAETLRLRDRFERMMLFHPRLDFISVGLGLGLDNSRYVRIPELDLYDLAGYAAHFDVAIAPLVDTPFNRTRSNIKLKEYAAAGAPWIASDVGPYVGLGEQQGGRVISNDRWEDEINALIHDPERRTRLSYLGRMWARREDIMLHLGEWEEALETAVTRARHQVAAR